ncbi:MAG: hypothetical protein C0504_17335 [Candidatus Solibacter sp.]|nr:hypothetical protein [Candidatus Solibacter sp.]
MSYRLFVDEVGHADLRSAENPNERYLALTGAIIDMTSYSVALDERFRAIKQQHFGTDSVVLHRREILDRRGPFGVLRDDRRSESFSEDILHALRDITFVAITVAIDKKAHKERYGRWQFHPYHYCMTCLVERYAKWLSRRGLIGDVLAESRNANEDKALKGTYRRFYERGSLQVREREVIERLSSRELKLSKKSANINGLQLVDLIASPSFRWMLCQRRGEPMTAKFGGQVARILQTKYDRSPSGAIDGFGCKWLP